MMWNQFQTDAYDGMVAELMKFPGKDGKEISAYYARPLGSGPYPGIVLIHHLPGWDELYREFARRFAQHGFATICPNLYERFGHGTPDDVAAKARGEGGVTDEEVVATAESAAAYLRAQPYANGKVGVIGTCSGGRHSYVVGCSSKEFDAVGNLWGGRTPVEMTANLSAPVIGLFGNEDQNPSPELVNQLEEELKKHNKEYEFHRYDGAGHAFFYHDRPAYRQQQAMDGWAKVFTFFGEKLRA
jgi:carboxymethylenebutenolidase